VVIAQLHVCLCRSGIMCTACLPSSHVVLEPHNCSHGQQLKWGPQLTQ
jgi:hypothetical protein